MDPLPVTCLGCCTPIIIVRMAYGAYLKYAPFLASARCKKILSRDVLFFSNMISAYNEGDLAVLSVPAFGSAEISSPFLSLCGRSKSTLK